VGLLRQFSLSVITLKKQVFLEMAAKKSTRGGSGSGGMADALNGSGCKKNQPKVAAPVVAMAAALNGNGCKKSTPEVAVAVVTWQMH